MFTFTPRGGITLHATQYINLHPCSSAARMGWGRFWGNPPGSLGLRTSPPWPPDRRALGPPDNRGFALVGRAAALGVRWRLLLWTLAGPSGVLAGPPW